VKLKERVGLYRGRIRDVDQLKSRLMEEWEHFHQPVMISTSKATIGIYVVQLAFEARAHGVYFEQRHYV